MTFIDNTNSWIKGEILEAALLLAFGVATLIAGILFWKLGSTPGAKAVWLPFMLIGLIYGGIGSGMLVSNQKRMTEFSEAYKKDKNAFIKAEKKRVEDFQYQYRISKIVATFCFLLTLVIFWFIPGIQWQGIGIGLTLFGLVGLIVDYFSEERAKIYYATIVEAIKQLN